MQNDKKYCIFAVEMKTAHIEKIRKETQVAGADAILITSNTNMYYAVGQIVMGYLYIPVVGDPVLFVRRPNNFDFVETRHATSKNVETRHATSENVETRHATSVHYVRKPEQMAEIMAEHGIAMPQCIMLEGDSMSHSEWLRYEAIFPTARAINGTPAIQRARSIKTDDEIELLRRSGRLHVEVYRKIPELYRKGMTDVELSIEIERLLRLAGNLGVFRIFGQSMEIFMGSLLAGDNGCEASPYDFALGGKGIHPSIPVGANNSVLEEGMSVMVDMNGNFTGYMTDMTRTFSIGKLAEKAYRAHRAAIEIENEIAQMMRPGVVCEDIYVRALDIAKRNRLDDCFMGSTQQARFVGHGVGIEVNEMPVLAMRVHTQLEAGMTLAIEPKFVIKGTGAVGFENTFVITENGNEKLTVLDEEIIKFT